MTRTAIGFLGLLLPLPALQAQVKPEKQTPAQQYQALEKEYDTAVKEFNKAYKEAKTAEDKQKVFQEKYPRLDKFAPRFLELAEKNPKDPAAVDALVWTVTHGGGDTRTKAIKILSRDHVQSEKMATLCPKLGIARDKDSRQLLTAVLEKSKHRPSQAQACLGLAHLTENQARTAKQLKEQPQMAKRFEPILGKETVEELVKASPEKLSKEAEALYDRAAKDFADVADPKGGTV
ncbi:MAG TPA: hypothetical protein VFA15_00480, partial [Nitrososphaera sp.]|nr:hypothetical protein [Nitrososphaera sp.]